jgi:hypothetical protein
MTRTKPEPAAATHPNSPGSLWRRDKMQAACLSGCMTAQSLRKHMNFTASVKDRAEAAAGKHFLPLFGQKMGAKCMPLCGNRMKERKTRANDGLQLLFAALESP